MAEQDITHSLSQHQDPYGEIISRWFLAYQWDSILHIIPSILPGFYRGILLGK